MALETLLKTIAKRMIRNPGDPDIAREVSALVEAHGEWVMDSIVDYVVSLEQAAGTYSQTVQDKLRQRGVPAFLPSSDDEDRTRVNVSLTDENKEQEAGLLYWLKLLVPEDLSSLPREAHLTRVEATVWRYWVNGHKPADCVHWIFRPSGQPYSVHTLEQYLLRAKRKVQNCESLGWRTAYAESLVRGQRNYPPLRVADVGSLGSKE